MKKDLQQEEIDPQIQQFLEPLKPFPLRDLKAYRRGRAVFLAEARALAYDKSHRLPVSTALFLRLKKWMELNNPIRQRKERKPMFATIMAIVLGISLMMGGAGATTYAAQDSLPTEFLYPVKTWTENVRLSWTQDKDQQIDLLLALNDRRLDEILALAEIGKPIPEAIAIQLQKQLSLALKAASELEEGEMVKAMEKIQVNIRKQDQIMIMLHTNMPDHADPVLAQIRETIREQNRLVESGIDTPLNLQQQLQQRYGQELEDAVNSQADTPLPAGEQKGSGSESETGSGPNAGSGSETGSGPNAGPGPESGTKNEDGGEETKTQEGPNYQYGQEDPPGPNHKSP
jgi:hypothetical protein